MNRKHQRLAAALLACALAAILPITVFAEQTPAAIPKEEVVYTTLQANGQAANTYVVNAFYLAQSAAIEDYGTYTSLSNLTTTDQLADVDGAVRFTAPAGRFYYQGNLSEAQLPWIISIEYLLDGKPAEAPAFAGASGRLVFVIHIRANPQANPTFSQNYILQTTLTLDADRCANIEADGASIASAGKNKVITFTKMPRDDADFVAAADVTDFEMDGIQIAAVPFTLSFRMPSTEEFSDEIGKLQDGIVELDDGVRSLNDGVGSLNSGAGKLSGGMEDFESGMQEFKDGLDTLVGKNPDIKNGSQEIYNALLQIQNGLNQFSSATQDMSQLTTGSAAIAKAIAQISGGLDALNDSFASADAGIAAHTGIGTLNDANAQAIAALSALAADPANAAIAPQLSLAVGVLSADDQLISGLKSGIGGSNGLAAGAKALDTQYKQFDAGIQALPAALSQMGTGLFELRNGITKLASNYGTFHNGLVAYLDGAKSMAGGYQKLCVGFGELVDGTKELASGVSALRDGTKKLADGTGELVDKTSTMDTDMEDKIQSLMDSYKPGDFTAVSFVSDRNTSVRSVQFVMMSPSIKKSEQASPPQEEAQPTFWQRLAALFTPKK